MMKPLPKCATIIVAIVITVQTIIAIEAQVPPSDEAHSRGKRTIVFPYNAAQGMIWAIAVPLGVPDRNIFLSYNFEGNYNNPTTSNVFTEGYYNYIRGIAPQLLTPNIFITRSLQGDAKTENQKTATSERALRAVSEAPRKFITRKNIYHAIEEHLIKNGFNGKKCILRAICDAAELPMAENNGLVGDLVHILLSPSTSEDEHLPAEFYKAELLGLEGRCQKYHKHCKHDILELFSFIMEGIAPPLETPPIYIHRSLQGDAEIENSTSTDSAPDNEFVVTAQVPQLKATGRAMRSLPNFPRKFFTRKKIYHAIEQHLIINRFNGKKCILRAICDAAELPMADNNGSVGDLVHILLSPSTSEDEHLPAEFYKAELLGLEGRCQKYHKHCKHNILELFSFVME
ncbi:uncharacterized protein LOC129726572 [Wyeomyia smithii]|uniref:uncharacterized protein LOC129726572 n=1 Tax=Wyeomyia smithii TaxID=174621 RepID=UPI00246816D6|nr:uncharacterized protein LOC129726572 [Wyeomyia smithii]